VSGRRTAAGVLTFGRLKAASFTHSCVYLALLISAFALGGPQPETFILGLTHGLMWIGMSLVCLAAARARIIPLWLAVNVVVLGGLGPFAGSLGFVIEQRRRTRPGRIRTADQSLQLKVNDKRYQHR
jgi:hypothetical protein